MIGSTKHTILIVEHDDATRELYKRVLSQAYEVVACADDRGVPELLQAQLFSALVLEPALPNGRGWALLARLQAEHSTARLPVIVCSTLDDRKRGMDLGAAMYLIKPVLPTALIKALHHIIEQSEQQYYE